MLIRLCKIFIIQSFFTFSFLKVLAVNPGKIEGSISDAETSKAIAYAYVELLKSPDSTQVKLTSTNEEGKYRFEDVTYGKYIIRISCLGYRKQIINEFEVTRDKPIVKFSTTNLLTDSKNVNEVTIVGYKLTGIMEENKTIYAITGKSAEIAQSGLELLRQLPDVTVSYISDEVKLAGSSKILYQVNGKKVDVNYLEHLNPKLIDKIEVMTNPTVKYDSDVDAVINIIMKKNVEYGMSGRLRVDVPTSDIIICKDNGSLDFFRKKVHLFVAGNLRLDRNNMHIKSERITTLTPSVLDQNATGTSWYKMAGYSYGFDWFINDKNTINFYSSVQPRIPTQKILTSDNIYTSAFRSSHDISTNTIIDKNFYNDYSVFYNHEFSKNHDISFESYFSNKNSNNLSDYYEQKYLADDSLSDQFSNQRNQVRETRNQQLTLKIDYNYPLTENLRLSTGYNEKFIKANYSYYEELTQFLDNTDYNENQQIGYASLSWNSQNISLQAGSRYEFSDVHITHMYDTTNHYNSFLPLVSAQYKLGKKNTFRLSYRKSVIRPDVNQLSPTNYREDSYTQSIGNPKLRPSYNNRIEFTHRIQLKAPMYVSYSPYVNFITNGIRQITLAASDSITRHKYSNVSKDLEYGVTVSGTFGFVKWWTINPSFTYFRRCLDALPDYGIYETQKKITWRINVVSQFFFPKEWVGHIQFYYSSPYHDFQSTTQQTFEFVAAIIKPLNKKFSLIVFTINPWLNRYVFNKSQTKATEISQNSEGWVNYSYLIIIRLGYSFNVGKEGKKLDRKKEFEENPETKKGIFN